MNLPNIPVLLAAAVAVCLDFHAELSQKRKGICRRGWKTTTEFRPLVSEKLSFSVAKPNDIKHTNNPVGNFVKVCCEKFLWMIFNRSGIM